jgi:hypothetical protein
MSLRNQQIEHWFTKEFKIKPKAGFRKWLKKQRNRKIRQTSNTKIPNIKYDGWEY